MNIVVLAKSGCGKCHAAADKLRRLGLEHVVVEIDNPGDGWREAGAAEALAAAVVAGFDLNRPPVIVVDGTAYDYPAAMRALRGRPERKEQPA